MTDRAASVDVRDLEVQFRSAGTRVPTHALRGLTMRVPDGAFVAVIGPSGAGKTTLLRCLTGFVPVSSGTVRVRGVDVRQARVRQLRRLRCEVATVHQAFHLIERADVLTNTLVGRLGRVPEWRGLLGLFTASERSEALEVLHALGLAHQVRQRVDTLSGGERQRVAIARALVQRPHLVLADEPAASLDMTLARFVLDTLTTLNRERGVTVVVNLHDLALAKRYAARVIGMRAGRIVFDDAPSALAPANEEAIYRAERSDGGATAARSAERPRGAGAVA